MSGVNIRPTVPMLSTTPPPRPARPPAEACPPLPDSPRTAQLRAAIEDPAQAFQSGFMPAVPSGHVIMQPDSAEAAKSFLRNIDAADPSGALRKHGEFAQSFRMVDGRVEPNERIRYEPGDGINRPTEPTGTFISMHSHPHAAEGDRNNFPSPSDYMVARIMRKDVGQSEELVYHPQSNTFYRYTGEVPPTYQQAYIPPSPTLNGMDKPHGAAPAGGWF